MEHAEHTEISQDDVKLAIKSRLPNSFTQPPSREVSVASDPSVSAFFRHFSKLYPITHHARELWGCPASGRAVAVKAKLPSGTATSREKLRFS